MELIREALTDTGKLLPLLAIIYFLIAFLESRYGNLMGHFVMRLGVWGPIAGALVGCLPQCGFSVMAAALYTKRLVSVGTLLAVFISTSDEAVPVLLAMPQEMQMVGLLIIIKVMIAIIVGVSVDLFLNRQVIKQQMHLTQEDESYDKAVHEHAGCCSHVLCKHSSKIKVLLIHPLLHTLKIFTFLFALTVGLNFIVASVGIEKVGLILFNGTIFQPIATSFIGLIPNCFASVLLATFYAKDAISFGSLVAGLCAGSGLGLLVLVKENRNLKDTLRIIGLLLTISIFAGIIIQLAG